MILFVKTERVNVQVVHKNSVYEKKMEYAQHMDVVMGRYQIKCSGEHGYVVPQAHLIVTLTQEVHLIHAMIWGAVMVCQPRQPHMVHVVVKMLPHVQKEHPKLVAGKLCLEQMGANAWLWVHYTKTENV